MKRKLRTKSRQIAAALNKAGSLWASLDDAERSELSDVVYQDPDGLPIMAEVGLLAEVFARASMKLVKERP